MTSELPSPPPHSGFQIDRDADGLPRLMWPNRISRAACFKAVGFAVGFCCALYFFTWLIRYEIDYSSEGPFGDMVWTQLRKGNSKLIGLGFILLVALIMMIVIFGAFLRALLFGRGVKRQALTFGADPEKQA